MRLASVAVPVPFLDPLTYRVPDGLVTPLPGARVLVPLGTRTVTGCVVSRGATEERNLKDLIDVLDAEPFLPRDVLELALWVAEYYACGPGEAVAAAMPPYAWLEASDASKSRILGEPRFKTAVPTGCARWSCGRSAPASRSGSRRWSARAGDDPGRGAGGVPGRAGCMHS